MPPAKKKQANAQGAEFETSLRSIVTRSMERSRDDLLKMNVIEYASEILKVKLWPTQRAILKALYNLPLESGKWSDILNTEQLMEYGFEVDEIWDERAILDKWVAEGKCTWKEGQRYTELNFECGMRGSKTSVTSIPVSFEFFRMGLYDDPAKQFNLMAGSLIAMLVLATSEEQAQDTLFAAIKGRIENSPYFQSKIASGEIIVNNLEILYPSKNIKLWAGHSRCVAAGTLIATTEGMKRVEDLVPTSETEQVFPVEFSVPTLDGIKHVTNGICMGIQPTVKLRTRWGYELEGSHRHPVLVMDKSGRMVWKKMPELVLGDHVAVRRGWEGGHNLLISPEYPYGYEHHYGAGTSNANDFTPSIRMTPDLARFMGYLTGDGSVTIADRVGLKSMDDSLIQDFTNLCQTMFNTTPILGTVQEDNRSKMYWAYNKKLKGYLEWLGMASVKASEKQIPWSIWQADEECAAHYLRGLFDTDGYASSQDKTVGFTSTSKRLVQDVQLMLLRLGIISQVILSSEAQGEREYKGKVINNQHDCWAVHVRGPEVDKYMSRVGFGLDRKTEAVPERNHKVVNDVIPYVHTILQQMRKHEIDTREMAWRGKVDESRKAEWHLIRKTIFNSHAPNRSDVGGVSALKLDRAIKYFETVPGLEEDIGYLKYLQQSNLFFDPIVELSEGQEYLYDFEVPDAHHFFSNGIVSHNSAGLVGRTLFMFAMDEADRFGIEGTGGASGADMYANVGKGTLTLRPFGSKKIIISSAWAEGDLTDTLHQQAMAGADHILSLQLATWDMNPQFMKLGEMHPDIQQEYATRGVEAMRDYAGIRPGSAETFFNKHAINTCPTATPLFGFEQYDRKVVFGESANGAEVMDNAFVDGEQRFEMRSAIKLVPYDVRPERLGPYFSFAHGDPGLVGDSFGFVGVHPDFNEEGLLIAVVNTLLQWKPTKKKGATYPVDFTNVDDVTVALARQIKLGRLSYDHWNSAMLIQRMYQQGVSTSQYKSVFNQVVQREMYTTLREWINMKRIVLPPRDFSPATQQLYRELEELRLINGRKIDHPKPRGSKDLADCLAAAVQKLADSERMFTFSRPDKNGRVEERAKVIGGVAAKEAFVDCFSEGHAMALRSNPATANMLKNPALPNGTMKRRTVIKRQDFYTDHV